MEEFGYKVSKDYEKLWELLGRREKKKVIFVFMDTIIKIMGKKDCVFRVRGEVFFDTVFMCVVKGEANNLSNNKDKFISDSEGVNLTFIDPNPLNPDRMESCVESEKEIDEKKTIEGEEKIATIVKLMWELAQNSISRSVMRSYVRGTLSQIMSVPTDDGGNFLVGEPLEVI